MDELDKYRVLWEETCWTCKTEDFNFQCTDELTPLDRFIGQDRALDAIRFGLEVDKPGYNLFVTGLTGTGKTSAIKAHLESIIEDMERQEKSKPPCDWCYAHNFDDPDRPFALSLPAGEGKSLRSRMTYILALLREEMPKVFKSEQFEAERREMEEKGRLTTQEIMGALEQDARSQGFAVQMKQTGMTIFPMVENRAMSPEEYQALDEEQRKSVDEVRNQLMQQTQETMAKVREAEKESWDLIHDHERSAAEHRVADIFRPTVNAYEKVPEVDHYLRDLADNVLDHLNLFKDDEAVPSQTAPPMGSAPPSGSGPGNPFLAFEINLLVDNSDVVTSPIVVEPNPNWGNLFGRIERRATMGTYFSDHSMLKPGSIHQANGGYLVLNARDVLTYPPVWEGLKRVIRNREIRLEDPAEQNGFFVPQGLRPEPIPLDIKVIITGDESTYRLLTTVDNEDFWDLFKVKAEFDNKVDITPDNIDAYCAFICRTCEDEGLRAFDANGAARVIEFAARMVSDQKKLSTRFGQIKDLLIESDYWAGQASCELVLGEHVEQAVNKKIHRLNIVEERVQEMVENGSVLLDFTGSVVGQVNGLAVYDLGDFSFGRPSRITAQTFAGREGVINIEREASLSGSTHDKGVLILSGYLGAKFGQERPLTLSSSLCFEQSYDGVDGDSASSTELYAIMSSLSGLPLKQNLSVTGSVNQMGEIQPIGGVNQKVEGMFDVCRIAGLTGDQGVMVPHQNLRNLMLRADVVAAIKEGKFHIYSVRTIDEGLEILTGVTAGERGPHGEFPEGTVNGLVEKRLGDLHQSMRGYYEALLSSSN
ncbi:MAG: ATP-binding protein [Chloroflexota bacterium]|nr:ATP-binding protein [Chloroflexota bacterium]